MTSSRNPTPRPRRVAGASGGRGARASEVPETSQADASGGRGARAGEVPETSQADASVGRGASAGEVLETSQADASVGRGARASERLETSRVEAGTEPEAPEPSPEAEQPPPARRTTLALVLAIVLLVAVALLEAAYLWGPLQDEPTVSAARPVVTSEASHRSVVDTAAKAAVAFSGRSYETYDEQVDQATAMMTSSFAEEYRQTTDQVRDDWIAEQTVVIAELEAQAVITASSKQVEALVFLTQFIERKGAQTAVTPFRIKVTMVDTEQGWLVSDVESA